MFLPSAMLFYTRVASAAVALSYARAGQIWYNNGLCPVLTLIVGLAQFNVLIEIPDRFLDVLYSVFIVVALDVLHGVADTESLD